MHKVNYITKTVKKAAHSLHHLEKSFYLGKKNLYKYYILAYKYKNLFECRHVGWLQVQDGSKLSTRGVPIWVFGMYRYPILVPPKEADNR